jgi:hypothetical protein
MTTNIPVSGNLTPCSRRKIFRILLCIAAILMVGAAGSADNEQTQFQVQSLPIYSGVQSNTGSAYVQAYNTTVLIPGATWLRLHFSDVNLISGSYIEIASESTGTQILDATTNLQNFGRFLAS